MTRFATRRCFVCPLFPPLSQAWAQDPTAAIDGTVSDGSGLPIAGALVVARALDTGIDRGQRTDERGSLSLLALQVDDYRIEASSPQFAPWFEKSLHLNVSQRPLLSVHRELCIGMLVITQCDADECGSPSRPETSSMMKCEIPDWHARFAT